MRRFCDSRDYPYLSRVSSAKLGRIHPVLAPRQNLMFRPRFLATIMVAASLTVSCQAQSVDDLADLFPPESLFYFEVVKPADISRQVATALKGTILEDMPSYMTKWR